MSMMLPSKLLPKPRPILPIQYLRGVAALAVVWHHARGQLPGLEALFPWDFGTSGVDLFFVISGFIMVVTTIGSGMRPQQFLWRRIIRVVPLYWLLTLSMVVVALVVPSLFNTLKVSPNTLLQSLLFIPHFSQSFPDSVWPLLVPGWTLNFEMFFYAVFGVALFLPARCHLAAVSLFLLALICIGFAFGPFSSAVARAYTHPMLLEFVAGALIGGWWLSGQFRLPEVASALLIAIGVAMLVLRDRAPLGYFTQIIGAVLGVVGSVDRRFGTWNSRVLQALGDSSYSLYLTHIFTLGALRVVWSKLLPAMPALFSGSTFMLMSLLVCAAVGWLTYRWVETPLLRGLSGSRSAPAGVMVAAS